MYWILSLSSATTFLGESRQVLSPNWASVLESDDFSRDHPALMFCILRSHLTQIIPCEECMHELYLLYSKEVKAPREAVTCPLPCSH